MNMNYSHPHNSNNESPPSRHFYLCNTRIRAYYFFTIDAPHLYHRHTLTRSLRYYHPLAYPYTWFVYEDQAVIINTIDLQAYYEAHRQPDGDNNETRRRYNNDDDDDDDNVSNLPYANIILDEDIILQYQINESFQQAADFNAYSGLTKEVISENLDIRKYKKICEEDEEICVICQVGFEKDETIGVVECKHRYHAECITEWLIRKNACPLCKAQALTI